VISLADWGDYKPLEAATQIGKLHGRRACWLGASFKSNEHNLWLEREPSVLGDKEQVRKHSFLVWRLNLSRNQKGVDGRSLRCSNGVKERRKAFSSQAQKQMGEGDRWGPLLQRSDFKVQ
jgi:hypothetical protein